MKFWTKLICFDVVCAAEYIPGDQVTRGMFAFAKIRPENCPRSEAQQRWITKTNKLLSDSEVSEMASHELKRLDKMKKQMEGIGISFDCQAWLTFLLC